MSMLVLTMAMMIAARQAEPDVVLADFEGPNYGGWKVSGDAFGAEPAPGTWPNQMRVSGFEGRGLVNSFRGGDAATGRLISPEFIISRRAVTFLIGGGGWAGKTCMNLLVDGKVVRAATGPNTREGGSEALERMNWDVAEFAGKTARIEIVDEATNGWGHINVDQIVLTDQPPLGMVERPSRIFTADKRYLNLPIRNDAPLRRLVLMVDGRSVNEFEAGLTDQEPDYWVFLDISGWTGKQLELRADRLPANGAALDKAELSDSLKGVEPLYAEKLRPQFHFSSRRGWLNDPNGLVFADGEYHLYYQHNPFGWAWGNMHWGHAVSPDLLHWRELPIAITPRAFGDWAYSGSAVVDARNSAGWRTSGENVIVAAFTSTARGECITYSNDGGRTFTEFEGNPVVTHMKGEGRDPRLFWYAKPGGNGDGHWVMAVYNEDREAAEPDRRGIAFYTSDNLKTWTYRSRIGGFFECPDLFELPIDGGRNGSRWVLTAANSEYMIGGFDGEKFTPDEPAVKRPGNRSDRFYAAQTYSQTSDGRRIQIGWCRVDAPGMPFNQMMSFPCELTLRTTPAGVRLFSWPVKEIERLQKDSWAVRDVTLVPGEPVRSRIGGELLDVSATLEARGAKAIELKVRGVTIRLDPVNKQITCDGKSAPLPDHRERISIRVLVDRGLLEIFAGEGEVTMTLAAGFAGDSVELSAEGGEARIAEFAVRTLGSVWGDRR